MKAIPKTKVYLLDIITVLLLVIIDQIAKYFAVIHLKGNSPYVLWNNVFELHYVENRGAAFGMLQGQLIFFIFITVLFLIVVTFILIKIPKTTRYLPLNIVLLGITAGSLGNFIDRIRLNYVVDFFYFKIIDFPVFNFADICVSVSTVILLILILFVYKENDLSFLDFRITKYREIK